jgi:hypothetical protein
MALPQFPYVVEKGSVSVTIYHGVYRGYHSYTVSYYQDGVRKRPVFADFKRAKKEAIFVARRLGSQDADVLELRSADRAAYQRARQLLDPIGVGVEMAAAQFADAKTRLGAVPLSVAVDFYLHRHKEPAAAPVGEMPGVEDDTPDHKVIMLSRELPLYVKPVAKLNQRPVFTQSTLEAAREWFQRNTDHEWMDILAVCARGIKNARENPAPEEGFDPYFWSRKYAHKPNKLFETNAENDPHLSLIMEEGKWAPDAAHGQKWIDQLTQSEAKLAVGKAK